MDAHDALIIVDVQNDFCPGGALPVEHGDEVTPMLNRYVCAAQRSGAWVVASRDWHPRDHCSFDSRGGPWPEHCIQGTTGAEFHSGLGLPDNARIVDKGTTPNRDSYSAFDRTTLTQDLVRKGVERVWVGGLATEVCVRATVLDACRRGFEVHLIRDGSRPLNAKSADAAMQEMREAGAIIE